MALGAEGAAALDCFEVTLKCEEAEDDEEAVVVAVIPRPEPMLRGEGGGPHFRMAAGGSAPASRPSGEYRGPRLQPRRAFPVRSGPVRVRRVPYLLPHRGLESQASRSAPSSVAPPPLRV